MQTNPNVVAERARYTHSTMLPAIFLNLTGAVSTAVILSPNERWDTLAAWVCVHLVIVINWVIQYLRLRGHPFDGATPFKLFAFVKWTGLAVGVAWALGAYFFLPHATLVQSFAFLCAIVLLGVTTAICFAAHFPAFLWTFLPYSLAAIPIFAMQRELFLSALLSTIMFIPPLLVFAHRFSNLLLRSLELQYKNLDLVEQITRQKIVAEEANQSKTVFLAKVSHELRTPLHAVLGYLDLALRENLVSSVAYKLTTARKAGQQLVGQIDELLDYARLERAMLKIEPFSVALPAFAHHIKEMVTIQTQANNNRLELHLDPKLPLWVWMDGSRVEQILIALLNNALRYTQAGAVSLRITHVGTVAELVRDQVRFEVQDTGRGIAPEDLAKVFRAFERGVSSDSDGMGLGLPISQQLLLLMGSHLEVHSEVGVGSVFAFTLDLERSDESLSMVEQKAPLVDGYEGATRKVLVLDDNALNRRYLGELLGDLGFDVRMCSEVTEAVAYLEQCCASGERFVDLCLIDQRLEHGSTGWEFVQALRQSVHPHADLGRCPIVMLSATNAAPPAHLDLRHEIAQHMLKPIDQQLLLQVIGELLQLEWTSPATQPAPLSGELTSVDIHIDEASAWEQLLAVCEAAELSALDDWAHTHAALMALHPELLHPVETLNFTALADIAAKQQTVAN